MNTKNPFVVSSNRKIDPSRRRHLVRPDGTPDDNDRVEIGPTALAFEEWGEPGADATEPFSNASLPPGTYYAGTQGARSGWGTSL